jgi:hypothetical protein
MPWKYNITNSSTVPTPDSRHWSGSNTLNQESGDLSVPGSSAITKLRCYAAARTSTVSTRLVLWANAGSALAQSSTFTMATGTDTTGGQAWQEQSITPYLVSSTTTYWIGLYRNPAGAHYAGVNSGTTGYRKTNTAGFPSVSSMLSASETDEMLIGVFYITAPDAPTSCTVSRNSDTSQTITWTNHATTDQPYDNIYLERWDNVNNKWYAKATLSSSIASYTDTTTTSNRQYQYRVRAKNTVGYSSYSTSATINTTPSIVNTVVATRSSGTITITWVNPATNETSLTIQRKTSTNGVTWSSYSTLSSTIVANVTSYIDSSPANYNKYQIKTVCTTPTLSSAYVESNTVQTIYQPQPPTNLAPDDISYDASYEYFFSWQHNPVDTTTQTKFSLQYKASFDVIWTTLYDEEVTANQFVYVPADTFSNADIYQWQIKTWGDSLTGSDWSSIATFSTWSLPTCTITDPTDLTDYAYSTLTASWIFSQPELYGYQQQYEVYLFKNGDTVTLVEHTIGDTAVDNGETCTHTFTNKLLNNETYSLQVRVKSHDLWSDYTTVEFTTSFTLPMQPSITCTIDSDNARTMVEITNPNTEVGYTDTSFNRLYRYVLPKDNQILGLSSPEYHLVLDNIPLNTVIYDINPTIGYTNKYYLEAVTVDDAVNTSEYVEVDFNVVGYYYLNTEEEESVATNGANSFEYIILSFIGDVVYNETISRDSVVKYYAGRTYGVKYQGRNVTHTASFTAEIAKDEYENLLYLTNWVGNLRYRDWRGRNYLCNIKDIGIEKNDNDTYKFSCTLERVESVI